MMRALLFLLTQAFVLALVVLGTIYGVDGALRALGFWAAFSLLFGIVVTTKEGFAVLVKDGPPVKNLNALAVFNVSIALVLAWHAEWLITALWTVSSILLVGGWRRAQDARSAQEGSA